MMKINFIKYTLVIISLIFIVGCSDSFSKDVYICTGPKSKSYHKSSHCEGLRRCSSDIKKITKEEAINRNRKPCRYCYN